MKTRRKGKQALGVGVAGIHEEKDRGTFRTFMLALVLCSSSCG